MFVFPFLAATCQQAQGSEAWLCSFKKHLKSHSFSIIVIISDYDETETESSYYNCLSLDIVNLITSLLSFASQFEPVALFFCSHIYVFLSPTHFVFKYNIIYSVTMILFYRIRRRKSWTMMTMRHQQVSRKCRSSWSQCEQTLSLVQHWTSPGSKGAQCVCVRVHAWTSVCVCVCVCVRLSQKNGLWFSFQSPITAEPSYNKPLQVLVKKID